LRKWGPGTGESQFAYSYGIAVDVSGNAYITDSSGHRVLVFGTPVPPLVITGNSSFVTRNSAILDGNLDSLGSANNVNVSFEWGLSSGIYTEETIVQSINTTGSFRCNLGGLSANTTYYYRAKGIGDGLSHGEDKSFVTLPIPITPVAPVVNTNYANDITAGAARLIGELTSMGSAGPVNTSFQWGSSSGNYTANTTVQSCTLPAVSIVI